MEEMIRNDRKLRLKARKVNSKKKKLSKVVETIDSRLITKAILIENMIIQNSNDDIIQG